MTRKILPLILTITFFINGTCYGLSPWVGNPETYDSLLQEGRKAFLAEGPGVVLDIDKLTQNVFVGEKPVLKGIEFITPTYDNLPEDWTANRELYQYTDLIEALKYVRKIAGIPEEVLAIKEVYYELERDESGKEIEFAGTRLEKIEENGTVRWELAVHTKLCQSWEDNRLNDEWFTIDLPDSSKITHSVAWGKFFHIARHYFRKLGECGLGDGGHIIGFNPAALGKLDISHDENKANTIGGKRWLANYAIWIWLLGSYALGDSTRYNNEAFKQQCHFILNDPRAKRMKLDEEFPVPAGMELNKDFLVDLACAINYRVFSENDRKVPEFVISDDLIRQYKERKKKITETIYTGGTAKSKSPNFQTKVIEAYQKAYGPAIISEDKAKRINNATIFPILDANGQFVNIAMKEPSAPEDGLVVALESSYICGTDIDKVRGNRPLDRKTLGILGHEAVGRVIKVGKNVTGYHVGDRILFDPNIGDNECAICKRGVEHLCDNRTARSHVIPGLFAPYAVILKEEIKAGNIIGASDSAPSKYTGLAEPIACSLYDLETIRKNLSGFGDKLVIHGAGFQGIMHAVLASRIDDVLFKDIIIFDTDPSRVKMARKVLDSIGLYHVKAYNSSDLGSQDMDRICKDADATVIAFSPRTEEIATEIYMSAGARTRKDGVVSVYGGAASGKDWHSISVKKVHSDQVKYIGNTGAPQATLKRALKLIEESDALNTEILDTFITHEVGLENLEEAFNLAKSGEALKVRVICNPDKSKNYDGISGQLRMIIDKATSDGFSNVRTSVIRRSTVYYMDSDDMTVREFAITAEDVDDDIKVHLECYRKNPDILSVVQTESQVVKDMLREGLISEEKPLALLTPESVAIPKEKQGFPVVENSPKEIAKIPEKHYAVITQNGTIISFGTDLKVTYWRNKVTQTNAEMVRAALAFGTPDYLNEAEAVKLLGGVERDRIKSMGQVRQPPTHAPPKKATSPLYEQYIDEITNLREKLHLTGQKIADKGLVDGPGGNISTCTKDRKLMVIKASGCAFESMGPEEFVVVNLKTGKLVKEFRDKKPSVETAFHRAIYLARKDVFSVVHTHPAAASALATVNKEISVDGKVIPVIPYIYPGSDALAEGVSTVIENNDAMLMKNHGSIVAGKDLNSALEFAVKIEDRATGILQNKKAFEKKLNAYYKVQEALKKLEGAPGQRDLKKILKAKNDVNFAREEFWMESEVLTLSNTTQLEDGDVLCDLRTKEIKQFTVELTARSRKIKSDVVVLRPLSLTASQRKHRDTLVETIRYSKNREKRNAALATFKSMVDRGILPIPKETNDVFQHCHSTYSHSPGNTPAYIAWRGYVLGLLVTGIVDHDTVDGIDDFLECAQILDLRNPTSGYEQRCIAKGTPFEFMTTNSPGNDGETYVAFHGVSRRSHKIQEERVVPAKIERFKKNTEYINNLNIIPQKLDYETHVRPLTENNNPTEKHLAEAIARLIYANYEEEVKNGEWSNVLACAKSLVEKCPNSSILAEEEKDVEDLVKFIFLMRNKVVTPLKQLEELQPTEDEVVQDRELYDDAHAHNELVYYCYLGASKCQAEDRTVLTRETKLAFIRDMRGSLPKDILDWWLAKENASMLHLWFRYQKSIGADGVAFMPNRNSPEEIEEVIKIAQECGFDHIANGMDVNTPDMPYTYYDYSNRPGFVKESMYIVEHENEMRKSQVHDPEFGNKLAVSYRDIYKKHMVTKDEAEGQPDIDAIPVAIPAKLKERKELRLACKDAEAGALQVFDTVYMKKPEAPEGGLVIELEACYICGTDTNHYIGQRPLDPNTLGILGHEAVGKITNIGKGVEGYEIGERVLLNTISSDMTCAVCKHGVPHECTQKKCRSHQYPGYLTKYAIFTEEDVSAGNVIKIGQNVDPRYGALAESIACSLHDMMNTKRSCKGEAEKIVIWGTGFQGIIHAALAALVDEVKYNEIILLGRNDKKNREAEAIFTELGLQDRIKVYNNQTLSRDELEEVCGEADVSVIAFSPPSPKDKPGVAAALYDQVVALTRKGGVLSLYGGVPEHWPLLSPWYPHYHEINYIGNSGAPAGVLAWAHKLIEKGVLKKSLLDALISHEYTLDEVDKALEASASREALKVLVRCNSKLLEPVEIDGLVLRAESSVSILSDGSTSNFEPVFNYTLNFYDGRRKIAGATVSVNDNAILLPACTKLNVVTDMRGRGIGNKLILQAIKGANEEAKLRGLNPKWVLFTVMQDNFEDHVDAAKRLEPMSKILKKFNAGTYDWGWSRATQTPVDYDDVLEGMLRNISPDAESGTFVHFVELERLLEPSATEKEEKTGTEIRSYEPGEADASVGRLETLINTFLKSSGKNGMRLKVDTGCQDSLGFRKLDESSNVWVINPNALNHDAFLSEVAKGAELTANEQTMDAWKYLQNQVWLDNKLEFAVRDVPWIQETDIRIADLYDPSVRLLVGLGDVRGSASYQSFYVNYYRNEGLPAVQDIFKRAGYRMLTIPVQMVKEDLPDIPRILQTILGDRRIIRIALTKPTKVAAVETRLIDELDPDTLDTGAVNTSAIEGRGSSRHFIRRTTDGLGTVAKAKQSLSETRRLLNDSIAGIIGLGGFGLAVLGKLLTDPDAPKEIRIAVRDKSFSKAQEALASIQKAYNDKLGHGPRTQVRIYTYSELDHAQEHHPFKDADVLFDCTDVGMNDDNCSLSYLDFLHPDMIVFHAAYRDANKKPRVPPILVEARKRGAMVHNGIADWLGHQYMQVTEDLKRAAGLTPAMPEWNDDKWIVIRGELEKIAFRWANAQGLKDAMDLLEADHTNADGHEVMRADIIPELMERKDFVRITNWLTNLWRDLPQVQADKTLKEVAVKILHHKNCSEFLASPEYMKPELENMRGDLTDTYGLTVMVRSVIAEWQILIAKDRGHGSQDEEMPELSLEEAQGVWEMLRLLHDGRQIEIITSQRFYNSFTQDTHNAIDRITRMAKKAKGKEAIKGKALDVKPFSDRQRLMEALRIGRTRQPNVQRLLILEKRESEAFKKFLDRAPSRYENFRNVRILTIELPPNYYKDGPKALSNEKKTAHQGRVLNLGILARLIERGKTRPILEALFKSMLKGHVKDSGINDFADDVLAPENESTALNKIAQRVLNCLNKIVSLISWLEQELRNLREFWRSA
ncbi:MAG: class II aldolase/adducin family protein [Candidatus Omnitrophica bacterium]|nr:class II aldolase/adducin family protein [Candidatus Omnitrophota bacterium]